MRTLFTKLIIGFDFVEMPRAMDFAKKLSKITPSIVIENVTNFSIVIYVPKGNLFNYKDNIKECFAGMEASFSGESEDGEIVKFTLDNGLERTAQQRAQNLF